MAGVKPIKIYTFQGKSGWLSQIHWNWQVDKRLRAWDLTLRAWPFVKAGWIKIPLRKTGQKGDGAAVVAVNWR